MEYQGYEFCEDFAEKFAGFDRGDGPRQWAAEDAARIEQWERELNEDAAR